MFFRRQVPVQPTFAERLQSLETAGFAIREQAAGVYRATRGGCAALVRESGIERAGWLVGDEIAQLVDAGYQKFWAVTGQRRAPALAGQLTTLHAFEEDLREGLGLESRYNTSLGTTNDLHAYDRLEGR